MKKKILVVILILVVLISSGIVYLNNVLFPVKIRAMITQGIEAQTQKKVSLESVRYNIFKGLVLKNLSIYDGQEIMLSVKEASCMFLVIPLFKKMVVVPALTLQSPEIFLQRRKDGTFNQTSLLVRKKMQSAKDGFDFYIYKIGINDARIRFRDETLAQPFTKEVERLDLNLYLSLPASVKFNFRGDIQANPLINIKASGAYRISTGNITAKVSVRNLSPKEFSPYYERFGISLPEGILQTEIGLSGNTDSINADITLDSKDLLALRQGLSLKINSLIRANLAYGLKDKTVKLSGKAQVSDSALSGLGPVGMVKDINGEIAFSESEIACERLRAGLFGVPVEAKAKLSGLPVKPQVSVAVNSSLSLAVLQNILKNNFNISIPAKISGDSKVYFWLQTPLPVGLSTQVGGYVDITQATVLPEKTNTPINAINGRLEFELEKLKWKDLDFQYAATPYKTSGTLNNFATPQITMSLSSKDILLAANFTVKDKLINIAKLSGKRFNCDFAVEGVVDTAEAPKIKTGLSGGLNFDLQDAKIYFKKFEKQLTEARPSGLVNVQFTFKGDVFDFKSSALTAKLTSPSLSAWGLKFQDLAVNCAQEKGLVDISFAQCLFYDGLAKASAKINIDSANMPYVLIASLEGVKLGKLKSDTPIKSSDIAGSLSMGVKLSGFSDDISKLSGAGQILISDGKLWQLDLFKGMGKMIFVKDFATVNFREGSCNFVVQDKFVFTDNLKLKSDIAELAGAVKIGFDSSLDATLNVTVNDQAAPLTGTFRDVTTAIVGQAGKFGTITISGTLKEPKYKFKTAVADIIKSLKDVFLNR